MNNIPIFGPLLELLKSRSFMTAGIALICMVLVAYFPFLEEVQEEMIKFLMAIAIAIVGKLAYESAQFIKMNGKHPNGKTSGELPPF